MSVSEKMTAIADAIREKTGGTDALTLDQMAAAIPEVYDKGKRAERYEFWGALQNYGNQQSYYYAFCYDRLDDNSYNPQYDIVCPSTNTGGMAVFYANTLITDTKVPIYAGTTSIRQMFYGASNLKTIRLLSVYETTVLTDTFASCSALENITMGGTIGQNISFSNCTKLTHESLMSIIEHLSTATETRTLTLGTTNLAKLTDTEKAIATQKGWTLA